MSGQSTTDFDPTDPQHRETGEGLLEEGMGPGSTIAHLYRGEIHRMKYWRERFDRTTNWAVVVIATVITWAFAGFSAASTPPHYVILIGVGIVSVFLFIEARRHRGYEIWRTRVRLLQENVIAYGLDPSSGIDDPDWRAKLKSGLPVAGAQNQCRRSARTPAQTGLPAAVRNTARRVGHPYLRVLVRGMGPE